MQPGGRGVTTAVVLVVAAAAGVELWTPDTDLAEAVYLAVLVGAAVGAWAGVRRLRGPDRSIPRLVAAGITLNAVGELTWSVLAHAGLETDVSVADVAWFASYAALCSALFLVLRQSRPSGRLELDLVVDALTITVISVLLFWRFSIDSIVADSSLSPFVRIVWASYPVMDAVLLALVVRVLVSRRARSVVSAWFGVGVCLWLLADTLYLQVTAHPAATAVMNVAWMLAPVLMARVAWQPAPPPSGLPPEGTRARWAMHLAVAVGPLMVPTALEAIGDVRGQPDRLGQLLVGTAALLALSVLRTGRLIRSKEAARTELQSAMEAALAASEAKSLFMANMSHEIRTPLTTVLAAGELMTDTPLTDRQTRLLGMLRMSGQHLLALVTDILDFSKLEAGQAVVETGDFDLGQLVDEVLDAHRPRADDQGTSLNATVGPAVPPVVHGDRTRVCQVLTNLVGNAVKFTEHGTVHVDVRPQEEAPGPEGQVLITVSDTGIGIGPDHLALIFESFRQVDGTATRRYGGTGLGLAICRETCELLGGSVDVESSPGSGSTFTVVLPLPAAGSTHGDLTVASTHRHGW
jgi:signal transduction histidine kinase